MWVRLLTGFMLLTPTMALGQDSWVDKLTNQQGAVCCYNSDGRRLDDPEWRIKGNGYEVLFSEGWVTIPPTAVVPQTNKDGIARVWSLMFPDGRMIRCFMKGTEG